MSEQAMQQPWNIRVVRILIVNKSYDYEAAIIAFIANDNPLSALTEEYLLTQPRVVALGIEKLLSFKEDPHVNDNVSKWFSQTDKSEEAATKSLDWIERFITDIWTFHDVPPIKTIRTKHDDSTINRRLPEKGESK